VKKSVAAITGEVRPEEGLPRHRLAALGSGFQAVLCEDALDRVASELVTEVAERAADPRVTPARVLGGELLDDELAIPAQDRIGGHQAGELFQGTSANGSALRGEPAALGIGEAQASVAELLAQRAVLFRRYSRLSTWRRFTQPANTSSRN
jgi:hypothetical protein